MSAIAIDSLRKEYGDTVAVDDLTLDVCDGEVFGFLGPNGAGKSTTIDVVLGYARPTAGRVEVLGHDAVRESRVVRERVGVLPDGYSLYDRLTAREHVELSTEFTGADDDPETILERVGIVHAADRRTGGFSKGMSQRLALGMALVGSPDLLVFDEPSSGLDPTGISALRSIVREEASQGTTVFFSSHDLAQVEATCDRVGILSDGRLVAVDTVEGLQERFAETATLSIDADPVPDPASLRSLDGVNSATVEGDRLVCECVDGAAKLRVVDAIRESGATLRDFETSSASLEELFAASLNGTTGESGLEAVGAVPDPTSVEEVAR